jgi:hypothetical protein
MNADQATLMSSRIFTWLDTLTERAGDGQTFYCDEPRRGQRYVRVIYDYRGSRSVHAFYDIRTGEVYKAAGWKAPAKHVRFRLLDDASFARMIEVCDPYGGYLYIR